MKTSMEKINELTQYLRQMHLPVMADRLIDLYIDPATQSRTTLDILEEIIVGEFQSRRNNTIQRNLKQAKLTQPQAHIQAIDYSPSRKISKDTIDQLKTCQFIQNHRNVIIQGATGTGKSFTNALCRYVIQEGYTARYTRMYDLLAEIMQAELDNKLTSHFKKLSKIDLLVIDDFLLTPTTQEKQKYLMEIFELRSRDKSTLISSQMEIGEWHKKLGGGAIADTILDRAVSNSYHLYISGDSMRRQQNGSSNSD